MWLQTMFDVLEPGSAYEQNDRTSPFPFAEYDWLGWRHLVSASCRSDCYLIGRRLFSSFSTELSSAFAGSVMSWAAEHSIRTKFLQSQNSGSIASAAWEIPRPVAALRCVRCYPNKSAVLAGSNSARTAVVDVRYLAEFVEFCCRRRSSSLLSATQSQLAASDTNSDSATRLFLSR